MTGSKPISEVCTFVTLVSVMTGCTSTRRYLLDRRKDVADIFTLCGGVGGGGQVRVGRVPIGAVAETDVAGLRYGEFFRRTEVPEEPDEANTVLSNIAVLCLFAMFAPPALESLPDDMHWVCDGDFPLNNIQTRRGKGRHSPGAAEWFAVEVVGGVGPMARVGFNAAELLDFAVGWTTIDILGDDWKGQERRMAQLAAERTAELARPDRLRPRYLARSEDGSVRFVYSAATSAAILAQAERVDQRGTQAHQYCNALGETGLKGASTVEDDAQSAEQTPRSASGVPGRLRVDSGLAAGSSQDRSTGRRPAL